jgi:hypothetical protein
MIISAVADHGDVGSHFDRFQGRSRVGARFLLRFGFTVRHADSAHWRTFSVLSTIQCMTASYPLPLIDIILKVC